MNKTKTITLWVDLMPGWQDDFDVHPFFHPNTSPQGGLPNNWRRVKITLTLPCFGGKLDETDEVKAVVEEEKS